MPAALTPTLQFLLDKMFWLLFLLSQEAGQLTVSEESCKLPGRAKYPFLAISLYIDMLDLVTNENRLVGKERS